MKGFPWKLCLHRGAPCSRAGERATEETLAPYGCRDLIPKEQDRKMRYGVSTPPEGDLLGIAPLDLP